MVGSPELSPCGQAGSIVAWLLSFVAGKGRVPCLCMAISSSCAPADLGGRQQSLAGEELMVCAVTASSFLGHPWVWQSSASSLKLDELINEPGKSGVAASSIIFVSFSRRLCPISAAGAQAACVSLPLCSGVAVSPPQKW